MQHTIDEYHAQGLTDKDIVIYPVGRKVYEAANKRGYTCVYPYPLLADKPNFEECRNIAMELSQKWLKGEFDKVEIIYHHFKSAGSQILQRKNFLPIDLRRSQCRLYARSFIKYRNEGCTGISQEERTVWNTEV